MFCLVDSLRGTGNGNREQEIGGVEALGGIEKENNKATVSILH